MLPVHACLPSVSLHKMKAGSTPWHDITVSTRRGSPLPPVYMQIGGKTAMVYPCNSHHHQKHAMHRSEGKEQGTACPCRSIQVMSCPILWPQKWGSGHHAKPTDLVLTIMKQGMIRVSARIRILMPLWLSQGVSCTRKTEQVSDRGASWQTILSLIFFCFEHQHVLHKP